MIRMDSKPMMLELIKVALNKVQFIKSGKTLKEIPHNPPHPSCGSTLATWALVSSNTNIVGGKW